MIGRMTIAQLELQVTASRCYGYTPDGDVVPDEAATIRLAVHCVLGEQMPMRRVVQMLNTAGARTVKGGLWQITPLGRLLTNPRLAGLMPKRRGSDERSPAIITHEQHLELVRRAERRRVGPGVRVNAARLLSGLVTCGRCGAVMLAHSRASSGRSYRCQGVGAASCGTTMIQAEAIERHVAVHALARLADRRVHPLIVPAPAERVLAAIAELDAQRDAAEAAYKAGKLTAIEHAAERGRLKQRRRTLTAKLADASHVPLFVPGRERVPEWWLHASISERRAVIETLFSAIVVAESTGKSGVNGVDTRRIQLTRRRRR